MAGKAIYLLLGLLVLGWLSPSLAYAGDPTLVGWWKLDEGAGTTVQDLSDYGNHGTLQGAPQWTVGMLDGALAFDGSADSVEIPHSASLSLTEAITVAAWIYMAPDSSGEMAIVSKGRWGANDLPYELTVENGVVIFWQFYDSEGRDMCAPDSPSADEWHHLAATYDGQIFQCFIDGVLADEAAYAGTMPENESAVTIGRRSGGGTYFEGVIDEVVIYSRALDVKGVEIAMLGGVIPELAGNPDPEHEAIDISRDTVLNWSLGEFASTHDVYLGTAFDDVNDASRTNPMDVLAGQSQSAATYDPGRLEFGQTYYWRVDEVNAAPDNTIFKGAVWSFATEPLGYPIEGVVATSNAISESGAGPENMVNGSGLDDNDLHSTSASGMWLGVPNGVDPIQIQFEFDQVYKLHEMLVWNYNAEFELILGFGLKDVTVEYSSDGVAWTTLGDVQLTQATARSDYAANTAVDLGGVPVRYVRLTVNSAYGMLAQYGLSEVRFLYIPATAREPQPADEATEVGVDAVLSWRAGREAASHEVYLDSDAQAVADGTAPMDTVTQSSYTPSDLQFGCPYYWKVVEVNDAEAIASWEGPLWSFTTQEYAPADDFEAYDEEDNRIYDTWLDGWINETGSIVGYLAEPFAETSIVHGGRQAMPLEYDNSASPFYSEASRTWASAQDWTAGGANSLRLYFHGSADNTAAPLYIAIEDSAGNVAVVTYPDPDAALADTWQGWTIPFGTLTDAGVNPAAVETMYVGLGDRDNPSAGGTGMLYIDDIGFGTPLAYHIKAAVTGPGDAVLGVPNDGDWPGAETPDLAIDDDTATKFLHFKGETEPTGLQVTPSVGATIVTELTLTTANDAVERDPASFELYGSNDGLAGPYTLIASGDIVDFAGAEAWPRFTANTTPITFDNDVAYSHYQLLFPTVRDAASANSMQIAEVELIGVLAP
jgi:concanavalin A-like lectin/glucanase superfamily protein/F5/8 type C domain-containing protein